MEKKRTISEFQNIKKIQSKFILTATSFFIFVAIAPVVIYVLASHFMKEFNLNITLLGQSDKDFTEGREGGGGIQIIHLIKRKIAMADIPNIVTIITYSQLDSLIYEQMTEGR